jgi:hypothetical protein
MRRPWLLFFWILSRVRGRVIFIMRGGRIYIYATSLLACILRTKCFFPSSSFPPPPPPVASAAAADPLAAAT